MAAFIPLALGAAQGFAGARGARRERERREKRLQQFLRAFFPETIPGGSFASNFTAQGNNRIGLQQSNLSNQLMALLGRQGNLGGGLQGGGQAAIGLAGNAQRNQLPLNLAQVQTGARTAGINAFNQGETFNRNEDGLSALLGGATQGLGAGLDAGLGFGFNNQQQQPETPSSQFNFQDPNTGGFNLGNGRLAF